MTHLSLALRTPERGGMTAQKPALLGLVNKMVHFEEDTLCVELVCKVKAVRYVAYDMTIET